jgi:hypothetical protein
MADTREAIEDFALHLAQQEPLWIAEDAPVQVRIEGQRHFILNEVDAGRLEALRQLTLARGGSRG